MITIGKRYDETQTLLRRELRQPRVRKEHGSRLEIKMVSEPDGICYFCVKPTKGTETYCITRKTMEPMPSGLGLRVDIYKLHADCYHNSLY